MSGMPHGLRVRLMGVLFVALVVGSVALTVALYQKRFTATVPVTLQLTSLPDQFATAADVKLNGMIVGSVDSISYQGGLVDVQLAMQPDSIKEIPGNVSAQLIPKTLFGPRYVALEPGPSTTTPLRAGSVIGVDRSSSAIEFQRVLDGLLPLLRQVRPQDLSMTLNAVSTALSGHGRSLGQTAVLLQRYVADLNTALPDIKSDISGLADVADTYSTAAPDLINAADDLTVTSQTVAQLRDQLAGMYPLVSHASSDLTSFLSLNQDNIVDLASAANPTLGLLARYSPEFPCTFANFAVMDERLSRLWGAGRAHPGLYLDIEVGGTRGKYVPGQDEAKYQDDRGPRCAPPPPADVNASQYAGGEHPEYSTPGGPVKDGSNHPLPERYQSERDPLANTLRGGR